MSSRLSFAVLRLLLTSLLVSVACCVTRAQQTG